MKLEKATLLIKADKQSLVLTRNLPINQQSGVFYQEITD